MNWNWNDRMTGDNPRSEARPAGGGAESGSTERSPEAAWAFRRCRCWGWALVLSVWAGFSTGAAEVAAVSAANTNAVPGAAIFTRPTLVTVGIELPPGSLQALRREPREYARATLTIDGEVLKDVAVKLKGAAGSFRSVDDDPALTVSFSKWVKGRRWQGLRQIHLNNSVQDSTLMNEYLAGELFRAAGVPATRVAWAKVTLNGRELGVYVLKEGFEEEFLGLYFAQTKGNLYDGGFLQDIDQRLQLSHGTGPTNHSDLRALASAARDGDPFRRWQKLGKLLDVDRFISYAAISAMITDWDGYPMNRNNYRVYFNPADGRAVFLPHGTDQLFDRNETPMEPYWGGLVAQRLFEVPEARRLYRERFVMLYTNVFRLEFLTNRIVGVGEALRPAVPRVEGKVRNAIRHVRDRLRVLEQEPALRGANGLPAPEPVPREGLHPEDWEPVPTDNSQLEEAEVDGVRLLRIRAAGAGAGSFRAGVTLPRGRYRFEGRARAFGIVGTRDNRGEGAGLRISGSPRTRENRLVGDHGWTLLTYEFQLATDGTDVTLVVELRGSRGRVEFERSSLRVVPLEP